MLPRQRQREFMFWMVITLYAAAVVRGEDAVNCSDWKEVLSGDERFTQFAAFVQDMDMLDVMRRNDTTLESNFTILAPVNEAMRTWQRRYEIGDDALSDEMKRGAINAILSYHFLVDGAYTTERLANTFGFATFKYKSGLNDLPVLVKVNSTHLVVPCRVYVCDCEQLAPILLC